MTHRRLMRSGALSALLLAVAAMTASAQVRLPDRSPTTEVAPPIPADGFLPDTAMLIRVDDDVFTAGDFVRDWFEADPPELPQPDSAGRVEFLNTMINKAVLGRVARRLNPPLSPDERRALQEYTQRTLSNVLYQRAVVDSARVDERDVERLVREMGVELHLRSMRLDDSVVAAGIRRDLLAKRTTWAEAMRRYGRGPGRANDGDMGWVGRLDLGPNLGPRVFALQAGAVAAPYRDPEGALLIQCVERRVVSFAAPLELNRRRARAYVLNADNARRAERLLARLRAEIGMRYENANIAWAAAQFHDPITGATGTISINAQVPKFEPEDTGRVLARYRGGVLTLAGFTRAYGEIPPLLRSAVSTPTGLRGQIDNFVLEHRKAELATARGLDRDPLAVSMIEERRERIMVEHLYNDSIATLVSVGPEERRRYYEQNMKLFVAQPIVRYLTVLRRTRSGVDSVAGQLRAGRKAEDLMRADSLAGAGPDAIHEMREDDKGHPFHALVFDELRPGDVAIKGPDESGLFAAIQVLSHDPSRQLSYEEAETSVDEAAQNVVAERRLNEFLARQKRSFRIQSRPELVMKIRLRDPYLPTP